MADWREEFNFFGGIHVSVNIWTDISICIKTYDHQI